MKTTKLILILFILSLIYVSCTPPIEKAEKHYEMGIKINYNNDPKGALVEFEKGLKYMPDHERLLYESGNCYMNFKDYHRAIDFYTKAIESNPKYADAFFNRGQCWFYLNERDKSCSDWKEAQAFGRPNLGDKLKHCK